MGRFGGLLLLASLLVHGDAFAEDKVVADPPVESPYFALIDGMKLVRAGKFDDWIERWCDPVVLCATADGRDNLRKYNLRALKASLDDPAKSCLKSGDKIVVTRETDADEGLRLFLKCQDDGMPRPFHLILRDGKWKYLKV